jgi:hypothetical protein
VFLIVPEMLVSIVRRPCNLGRGIAGVLNPYGGFVMPYVQLGIVFMLIGEWAR